MSSLVASSSFASRHVTLIIASRHVSLIGNELRASPKMFPGAIW